ncbi:hypothetical protein Nepgr_027960 [Nepenthes gracilis]|uniref:Uncharacterized protein n=1 Tax=Nepenthes gracilis TaxID=150966 RepID=A0AAD3TCP7_NEPGR|nr:hypothetical protein Nepgr_027960 [Nepenthes gracilis]
MVKKAKNLLLRLRSKQLIPTGKGDCYQSHCRQCDCATESTMASKKQSNTPKNLEKKKLKMPEYSYERAITKINEHRKHSKNGNHQPVAAAKIVPKRVEFEAAKSKGLDTDKRIKSGSKAEKSGKNPALSTKPAKGQSPKVEINVVIKPSCPGVTKVHTSISDHRTTSTHFIEKRSETYQHAKSTVKSNGGSLVYAEERKYIKKVVIQSKRDIIIRK